jgi:DNA-directed RNA polymerase specialized sigma24 family protein
MTSAGEVFVLQLARASRRANLFLRARGLRSHDRDDVIAAAILWCWENRHNYSLTTTLDTWFMNSIKDAFKDWARGEARNTTAQLSDIPTADITLAAAEAKSAAEALIRALPPDYKRVAKMLMEGRSRSEMEAQGLSKRTIDEARSRIKQLRRLMPDTHEFQRSLWVRPSVSSDDANDQLAPIDREIEALELENSPAHGKDCPPCWRCKWFEGYMPAKRRSLRMEIVEPEVKAAVANTEAEKIRIAQEVRDGNL